MPRTEEQQIRRWLRAHATTDWRRNHAKTARIKRARTQQSAQGKAA